MSYLISVVLPVHNCEKYLRECLDSIVNQSLGIENIEVIVVDDASTDGTYEIAKEYESKYPSFTVLRHESNKGCGPARNTGLEHVTTDYVTYLDGDDYISLNAYERALEIFNNDKEIDLVLYRWEEFDEAGLWNTSDLCKDLLKEDRIITDIKDHPEIIFATYAYIKVYYKPLFKYLNFLPGTYQDVLPSAEVMINAKKIYVTGDITVYYRQYLTSSSKDVSIQNYLNLLNVSKQIIDLREKYQEYYDMLSFLALRIAYWPINHICIRGYVTIEDGEYVYEMLKDYPQYFTQEIIDKYQYNFPNYLQESPEALWDINELDYYNYLIKHRFQKDIDNLDYRILVKDQKIRKLNEEKNNLSKENNIKKQEIIKLNKELNLKNEELEKLKKENKKKDEKIDEFSSSNSWKMTGPLRKVGRKIK